MIGARDRERKVKEEYDPYSCNALQRPFYRPVEAAIRWCNLISREGEILGQLGENPIPKTGQFPQWPCLQANTEKILDAIENGEIPYGRDGKAVVPGEHVNRLRLTVRHTDLRQWIAKHHPGNKPAFLFDEIERSTHTAINAESFRALQADRDALKIRVDNAEIAWRELKKDRDTQKALADSRAGELAAMRDRQKEAPLATREVNSLHRIIGALLELVKNPRDGRDSDAAVIRELVDNYSDKEGISKRKLEEVFPLAKRLLSAD